MIPAYLDPSSGSLALQVMLGGIFGSLALLRQYWTDVRSFVLRVTGRNSPPIRPRGRE